MSHHRESNRKQRVGGSERVQAISHEDSRTDSSRTKRAGGSSPQEFLVAISSHSITLTHQGILDNPFVARGYCKAATRVLQSSSPVDVLARFQGLPLIQRSRRSIREGERYCKTGKDCNENAQWVSIHGGMSLSLTDKGKIRCSPVAAIREAGAK